MKLIVTIVVALVIVMSFFDFRGTAASMAESSAETARLIEKEMAASKHIDSIVLGAGCFWGAEKRYAAIPGVVDAISGYAGGRGVRPVYQEIIQYSNKHNPENHAEVVKVIFNTEQVSLETILKNYFEGHDPTQLNRQGNDVGTQYRSIVLTNSDEQTATAQRVMAEYQSLLSAAGYGKVTTQVRHLPEFYPAEEYHQDYLVKNPFGYCPDHSTGVKFDGSNAQIELVDNSALRDGKQIVVVEAEHCPYCEKLKQDVLNDYQGNIPLTYRQATQLNDLDIKSPTWATPTILFLDDGEEVFSKLGYLSKEAFYQSVDQFNNS
ncbi:MAG: peptide-methionine (S)-S-oxide reductase MsrA [Xanthomonadales bacterium]|nr:peptide-methionine (S)-S-oxide reductase MsrA [Xanthomonadales bacterium]